MHPFYTLFRGQRRGILRTDGLNNNLVSSQCLLHLSQKITNLTFDSQFQGLPLINSKLPQKLPWTAVVLISLLGIRPLVFCVSTANEVLFLLHKGSPKSRVSSFAVFWNWFNKFPGKSPPLNDLFLFTPEMNTKNLPLLIGSSQNISRLEK